MSKPNYNKKQNVPENKTQGAEGVKTDTSTESGLKDQASETTDTGSGEKDHSETDSDKTSTQAKAEANETVAAAKKSKVPKGMEMYFRDYPKEKTFYRTTDGQVFLEANKQWAREHSNHIGGEIETIKRS
jgi:hypothetical protein